MTPVEIVREMLTEHRLRIGGDPNQSSHETLHDYERDKVKHEVLEHVLYQLEQHTSTPPPPPRETLTHGSTTIAVYADGLAITNRGVYVGGVQWEPTQEHAVRRALREWVRR